MSNLHLDLETYSSVNIATSGLYKYTESLDFEILMLAYAFDDEDVQIIDFVAGEKIPKRLLKAFTNKNVKKWAHNANFERQSFRQIGIEIPIVQIHCTAILAASCGLPLSLGQVSSALKLEEFGKAATGKALIKYFCCPIKPTKANGLRYRNFPNHDIDKWDEFKEYCVQDVVAEREIHNRLEQYEAKSFERSNYILDQEINDRGILVDLIMAQSAFDVDMWHSYTMKNKLIELTGLENPNSVAQLKKWLGSETGNEIKTLAKDTIQPLIDETASPVVKRVLQLRLKSSKSSVKKYAAMLNCACDDDRVRGLFQFYGANRTGRWAGRLVQLQNLPQNHLTDLAEARTLIREGNTDHIGLMYDDISSILSQLIRTTFIARPGHTFAVADFSAIEARVVAWLAGEKWRIDVFKTHGKIYEASASMMFNVPIEAVTKGSDLRAKGKNAELALGYQGSIGAMKRMGGEAMGLSDAAMMVIVRKWRKANPAIVRCWDRMNMYAIKAFRKKEMIKTEFGGIAFSCDTNMLKIHLPSGRHLSYWNPKLEINRFGEPCLTYSGVDQTTKKWWRVETYGGKIVENIVQATARDILAYSMLRLDEEGFDITMHVHDEAICEIKEDDQEKTLDQMCEIMGEDIPWAEGLPLAADGYLTEFYKKD